MVSIRLNLPEDWVLFFCRPPFASALYTSSMTFSAIMRSPPDVWADNMPNDPFGSKSSENT